MASCLILASFEHLKEVITRHKKYLINLVNSHMHLLNRVHAWLLSHIFCFIFSCASRVLPTSLPTYLSISHDIYLHSLPACCFLCHQSISFSQPATPTPTPIPSPIMLFFFSLLDKCHHHIPSSWNNTTLSWYICLSNYCNYRMYWAIAS